MKIKIATNKNEQQDAFKVRTDVFVHEQKVPIHLEMDAHDQDAIHFIGYLNGQAIAASRLRFLKEYGKLERICVLKPFRNRSYGKALIHEMEIAIMEQNCHQAKLHAQTHAIPFYKRLGYEVTSDVFLDANIPHVTMVKKLSPYTR